MAPLKKIHILKTQSFWRHKLNLIILQLQMYCQVIILQIEFWKRLDIHLCGRCEGCWEGMRTRADVWQVMQNFFLSRTADREYTERETNFKNTVFGIGGSWMELMLLYILRAWPRVCHLTSFNFPSLSAKMWLFLPDNITVRVRERPKTTIDCSSFYPSGSALSFLSGAGNLLFCKTRWWDFFGCDNSCFETW